MAPRPRHPTQRVRYANDRFFLHEWRGFIPEFFGNGHLSLQHRLLSLILNNTDATRFNMIDSMNNLSA
ncbi:MAG: hypothetical protein F6K48_25965 [Okeania sp. SIO3H1]|uniref:hypothetical protein n=1 Tax=Okeania sp. SIO1I7 TaxID=2607772 RepID=UPI0013C951AD|nr:hypothetical protein [Okeania sp. SIO1I7]NEN92161.1 hypothetical protein [Okeania sp. SIO3H1]NET26077.1 hypothetical protein [Okeania sp. SIO1I7]